MYDPIFMVLPKQMRPFTTHNKYKINCINFFLLIFRDTDVLKLKDHSGYEKENSNRLNSIEKSDEKLPGPLEVSDTYINRY